MILSTHAIMGAAVTNLFPHQPALGLVAAFGSHYLLDALPHWDYSVQFLKDEAHNLGQPGRAFRPHALIDFGKISFDLLLGLFLVLGLFFASDRAPFGLILAGSFVGMLPDLLLLLSSQLRWPILKWLAQIHYRVHSKIRLDGQPLLGALWQILLMVIAIASVYQG